MPATDASVADLARANSRPASGAERRSHERYSLRLRIACRSVDLSFGMAWHSECRDLSMQGLQIFSERRFEPRTLLIVEPLAGGGLPMSSLMAQVRWVEKHVERGWSLGCSLVHALSEVELSTFMSESGNALAPPAVRPESEDQEPLRAMGRLDKMCRNVHSSLPAVRRDHPTDGILVTEGLDRLSERVGKNAGGIRLHSRRGGSVEAGNTARTDPTSSSADPQEPSRGELGNGHAVAAIGPPASRNDGVADGSDGAETTEPAIPEEDLVAEELRDSLAQQLDADDLADARHTALALLERNPSDRDTLSVLAYLHDSLDCPDCVGELRCLTGHQCAVNCVAFSADGQHGFSGSGGEYIDGFFLDGVDRSLRVWELADGREVARLSVGGSSVMSIAPSACGTRLIVVGRSGDLCRIDPRDESLCELAKHRRPVFCTAISFDSRFLLTGGEDGVVRLYDSSGHRLHRLEGHAATVTSVAFAPDGRWAASASLDRTVRLWDLETGTALRWFVGHGKGVLSVAVSPDGRHILSGSSDTTLRLWDVLDGTELQTFLGHKQGVACVAFTPDGRRILSGGSDHRMLLWDAVSGAVVHQFQGHAGPVRSIAVSPGGRRALSGSTDRTVRLWALPR